MSDPRNTDHRLVEWLYGELDAGDAARFESELDADGELRQEAEGLRRTREVIAQLPAAEPPASLSSFLLHAAGKEVAKAPVAHRSEGFFAGMLAAMRSLSARPALAAAASLVAVAGVAGALYVTGGLRSTTDEVATSAEPAEAAAKEAAPVVAPAQATVPASDPEPDSESEEPEVAADEDRLADVAPVEEQSQLRLRAKNADKDSKRQGTPFADIATAKPQDRELAKGGRKLKVADAPKLVAPAGKANAISSGDYRADDDGFAEPPGTPGGTVGGMLGGGEGKGELFGATGGASQGFSLERRRLDDEWAVGQRALLVKAVAANDCSSAARIANDILDRNPSFYRSSVQSSAEVKKCQWYVGKESTRRAQLRAKKGAGDGSTSTAAPAKPAARKSKRSYDEAADVEAK